MENQNNNFEKANIALIISKLFLIIKFNIWFHSLASQLI